MSAAPGDSIPELDRRLQQHRSALLAAAVSLRNRMRHDVEGLSLIRRARRHPGFALAVAGAFGLVLGRWAARWRSPRLR